MTTRYRVECEFLLCIYLHDTNTLQMPSRYSTLLWIGVKTNPSCSLIVEINWYDPTPHWLFEGY